MSRLLPFQSDTEVPDDRAPRVVDLDGEDAEKVFGALSSETARDIFQALHGEPMTASDIAEAVDSSIQNVRYHLEKLEDAGLVEIVDTWYSSRGNEMKVYAPKDGPLIVSSDESRASRLRTALSRLVGGVGVLAAASLLVQYGSRELFTALDGGVRSTAGGGAGDEAPAPAAEDADDGAAGEVDGGDAAAGEVDGGDGAASTETATDGGVDVQDAESTTEPTATATESPEATEAAGDGTTVEYAAEAERTARDAATTVVESGGGGLLDGAIEPGLMFFLGGLVVLLALVAYQYRTSPYR